MSKLTCGSVKVLSTWRSTYLCSLQYGPSEVFHASHISCEFHNHIRYWVHHAVFSLCPLLTVPNVALCFMDLPGDGLMSWADPCSPSVFPKPNRHNCILEEKPLSLLLQQKSPSVSDSTLVRLLWSGVSLFSVTLTTSVVSLTDRLLLKGIS